MADKVVETPEVKGTEQADEKVSMTQSQLDALIQTRLDRDRKKYSDYDELKAKSVEYEKSKQATMTESEKKDAAIKDYEGKIAYLTGQITDREAKVLRVQMLEEAGLPTSWSERVHGTTPEEIKADVGELKKLIGVKKSPVGGSAAPAENGTPPDMNTLIRGGLGF